MIGFAFRQVELGQDAANVLLDGAFGHEDPTRDAGVGRALGHKGQDLSFAWRQGFEWITAPVCPYELLHQRWVDDRSARGYPLHRVDELAYVGYPTLQQIADSLPAGQQIHRLIDLDV